MLILLPPSEGKSAARRGRPMDPAGLSFPGLAPQRERVATALAVVSARPDAHTLLGVGASLVEEVARNTRLFTSPAVPAEQLYSGVLYGALDLSRMDAAARRRARRWIVVISALYGAVRLTDRVAPYRLSMTTPLPGLPRLATLWRDPLDAALRPTIGRGLVVDARSGPYVAAWPAPRDLSQRWVHVRVAGESHGAKHARGLIVQAICVDGLDPRTPEELASALAGRCDVVLTEPERAGRPWILNVTSPR